MDNRNSWALILAALIIIIPAGAGIIEVRQGDAVYYNETADLRLVAGWDCTLAYWNESSNPEDMLPEKTINVCENTKKILITPDNFPLGRYYMWSGEWEDNGNTLAFYVLGGIRPPATSPDKSAAVSDYLPNTTPTVEQEPRAGIPIKHIADLLIARGDQLALTTNESARVWIFGSEMIPARQTVYNHVIFTGAETEGLPAGRYGLIIQYPGINTIYEVTYNATEEQLDSPYKGVEARTVRGYQPSMIMSNFREMINDRANSDDQITVYTLEIQDPEIQIAGIDPTTKNGQDLLIVRGYTNVKAGAVLNFVVDKDKWLPREAKYHTNATEALDEGPGNMRDFTVQIPIDYTEMAPGQHFITGITPAGSETTVSFHIYEIPEGQPVPKQYLRYIGGSYEPAVLKEDPLLTTTPTPAPVITPEPTLEIIYVTPTGTPAPAGTPVRIVMSGSGERIEGVEPEPEGTGINIFVFLGLIAIAALFVYLLGKALYLWYYTDDPLAIIQYLREIRERFNKKPKPEAGGQ